jgi:hypothetical protein
MVMIEDAQSCNPENSPNGKIPQSALSLPEIRQLFQIPIRELATEGTCKNYLHYYEVVTAYGTRTLIS